MRHSPYTRKRYHHSAPPLRPQYTPFFVPALNLLIQIPRESFELAVKLAVPFNELTEAVSRDTAWLSETLRSACAGDPFTARLVDLLRSVTAGGGPRQPLHLGVLRSDYMLDEGPSTAPVPPQLRQIELNTISCSFAALSSQLTLAHRAIVTRFGDSEGVLKSFLPPGALPAPGAAPAVREAAVRSVLPDNDAVGAIAAALAAAHAAYLGGRPLDSAAVLFLVQPRERNVMDQRLLEQASVRGLRQSAPRREPAVPAPPAAAAPVGRSRRAKRARDTGRRRSLRPHRRAVGFPVAAQRAC